jgi:2-polyprenyl-3-methyl-5-hydroxy-6-metoxy-1,4-benzoquinol methylase
LSGFPAYLCALSHKFCEETNNFSGEKSMAVQTSELLEKIRQQFDSAPYPRIPVEDSPKDNLGLLYFHSLITPYYQRNQKVIDTKDKVILDAGCGSGYKSLTLALANPGAKVIGVDISEQSVKLAEQRLAYHGIENAEFRVCGIEDLPSLGMSFDYINCDELLYLFPSPAAALKSMGSVLKPEGIIRSNLHCAFQRASLFRAQELFKTMGLMEPEFDVVRLATSIYGQELQYFSIVVYIINMDKLLRIVCERSTSICNFFDKKLNNVMNRSQDSTISLIIK